MMITSVALTTALAGTATARGADADVTIEVSAARNILPPGGWTSVEANVRNLGTVAADNVRFTFALPQYLQVISTETSSEWNCESQGATATCQHIGPLRPGATPFHFRFTAGVSYDAPIGSSVIATASVTTSSAESVTGNNRSEKSIRFVGKGVVKGQIWHDLNANGVRDPGEPTINSIGVSFRSVDDEDLEGFSNSVDGTYWEDLAAKRFQAEVHLSKSSWRFTTPDVGSDTTDSDIVPTTEDAWYRYGKSEIFTVEAGVNRVLDVGVVAVPKP
ncbi:SdrD B-like domain-containing protein [Allokutzneria albata]|uniref:SD-repeat containing protein B domain-containing protein n=1 Tax=Allokutzneria albata TaxID=211114 RepID=A0A1G9SH85_ALLAB|nr:SdrD B-like domain-containing protein [Allokutzneria albata]SDM34856.1 hypothetical protein SAMN04489726_1178 [Allokutzneria albata]